MSSRFVVTFPSDLVLTIEQLERIAELLRSTERLRSEWVGKSDTNASGYIKKLSPTDIDDAMSLKLLTESDYNAYRFIAANAAPTV